MTLSFLINSNVNNNAIPRFSGSRSAPSCRSDVRAGHHASWVVQLIAAMRFGPLHPGTTAVWTKNWALCLSKLAYLHLSSFPLFGRKGPPQTPKRRVCYMWPQAVFQSDLI
jgi:hypothetical protein